ncbi:U-box domain-containing protein [Thalictrum thalictroides]|uniref:U-box domain-containing protein n=1 Tax=Thalictrum thalictroides TaxID=46969 RepID=A0A7J6UXM2_THATH|nr:U-box domain-containing protein [Thalictrum thalictroides]
MSVKKDDQMNIPHLFRCPISLDLFQDPVTLCTGQTYDRSNIEKWLAAGNVTCPVTMQKLHDLSLVPNHTLQHLIHRWLCMDNRFNSEQHSKVFDPKLSLIVLKNNTEAKGTTPTTKLEALRRIRILSEESEWRRSSLIQLGFFPMLLQVLFRKLSLEEGKLSQEDSDIAEQAIHCVLNLLPFSDIQSLDMLKEASHLASFFILLEQGSAKIKMNLCYLVEAIASSREISLVLGQTQCLWGALIDRLHDNSDASEAASKAILALCSIKPNRESFIREGGVNSLLSYISTPSTRPRTSNALATIKLLLESDSAKKVLVNNPNGIHILVKMVFGGCTDHHEGSDSAISSLLVICNESVKVREEAICAGILTQLLLLLQSQCSSRAKSKARMLLKLLRSLENPSKVATV